MKRFFACLLMMVMLLMASVACAEVMLPQVGDTIAGFTVTDVEEYPLMQSDLVYFVHEKTGAQLLWVANDDTERAFTVGFRTLDGSNKGTPHVFEHAALSGSEKYPDPSLFFSMMASTCQTYLNASTYNHVTLYPCASLSEEQLLKFVDVYMAGVYEPLVLTDINAMRREAYRYELADRDADITLTGTVYSEMLGSYTQNEGIYKLISVLYPGSIQATCTGGIPGVIETMAQQDLVDFHDKYYRPSNSVMVLYGDLDPTPFLKLIDEEYLAGFDDTAVEVVDADYVPFTGYAEASFDIAAGAEADEDITLYYAVRFPEMDALERNLAELAVYAMNAESSPVTIAAQQLWPECSLSVSILNEGPEPMLLFRLEHALYIAPEEFVSVMQEKTAELIAEGVDKELLNSLIAAIRKSQILGRESSGIGTSLGTNVLVEFGRTGDIHTFLDVNREMYEQMADYCEDGRLEQLLAYVSEFKDSRLVIIHTVPGLSEERAAAAEQKLVDKKAAMTEDELDELIAQTQEFAAWTDAVQTISMIDDVRVVTVDKLPVDVPAAAAQEKDVDGMRVISSEVTDCGLVEVSLYLDASHVSVEDLHRYQLAVDLLASVDTAEHGYADLPALSTRYSFSISAEALRMADSDDFKPVLHLSFNCLPEDMEAAFALVREVLFTSDFSDMDRTSYLVTSNITMTKIMASYNAYVVAQTMGNAAVAPRNTYLYNLNDLPYYIYEDGLLDSDAEAYTAELAEAARVLKSLCSRQGFTMTVVGSSESIARAEELGSSFYKELSDEAREAVDYASVLQPLPSRIAVLLNEDVYYHYLLVRMDAAGVQYDGRYRALDALTNDAVLMPVMRYRNGVYTPVNSTNEKSTAILAYRDPSISRTFEEVIPSLYEIISTAEIPQEALDGYIVKAYTQLALPEGPFTRATAAVQDMLTGDSSFAKKAAEMEALRGMKAEDIASMAVIYDALNEKGVRVTAGNAAGILENADSYDLVVDWYIKN